MGIRGKSVWIHDASHDLTADLALELAQMGNHVVVSGRDEMSVQRLIARGDGAIVGFPFDIASREARERAAAALSVMTDKLDIAICHNTPDSTAGLHLLQGSTMEHLTASLFTNAVHFVTMATPLLKQAARPRLLLINAMDRLAPHRREVYRAPEAALESFSRTLARDETYKKFSVNLLLVNAPLAGSAPQGATLSRQIIAAIGQPGLTIRIPPRRSRLRQILAWRPRSGYRMRDGLTILEKRNFP